MTTLSVELKPGYENRKANKPQSNYVRAHICRNYRQSARRSGREMTLTNEMCSELFQSPCHYCGIVRANKRVIPGRGYYEYNGIDRVDNAKGYTPDNVVPCCGQCNMAKSWRTYNEFLSWIYRIAIYQIINGGLRGVARMLRKKINKKLTLTYNEDALLY